MVVLPCAGGPARLRLLILTGHVAGTILIEAAEEVVVAVLVLAVPAAGAGGLDARRGSGGRPVIGGGHQACADLTRILPSGRFHGIWSWAAMRAAVLSRIW